jgi:hypothetical protein
MRSEELVTSSEIFFQTTFLKGQAIKLEGKYVNL